ncbi:hypothetical protein GQ53DRAFT_233748 [Thozetella sp. PMI_491]|nr:hypothetical protein GQ53DRAFT_233748 [Thozetella sp. PMI_491]
MGLFVSFDLLLASILHNGGSIFTTRDRKDYRRSPCPVSTCRILKPRNFAFQPSPHRKYSSRRILTMADYASLKVPELKKLLNERGLPQAGNKADLVKRLQENDGAKAAPAGGDIKDGQEEITYDDDEVTPPKPTEEPAAPAAAEPVKPTSADASAPAPAENAEASEAPVTAAEGDDATDNKYAKTMPDLAPTDAKTEAEKRAARAARFGIQAEENTDQSKEQKRAERFGLGKDQISALDSALPDRPAKRGRERTDDGSRDNKRGRGQGRQQGRGNHGGGRNRQDRRDGGEKKSSKTFSDDPAEKKKMEDRAKRFAN